MTLETEKVTEEVERERKYWACDGPGENGYGCNETWDSQEFSLEANIIIANPWTECERTQHHLQVAQPPREGYFISSKDEYSYPIDGMMHGPTDNAVNADGEIHLCNDCYEKIKPIFGMDGFYGQNRDEDDEEGEEEGEEVDKEDKGTLWSHIISLFR